MTKDQLNQLFTYKNGQLFYKKPTSFRFKNGDLAGYLSPKKYWKIGINGKVYRLHRIIFLMHHGFLPEIVDHADGNTLNNCIENLRPANSSKNQLNMKLKIDNKSGSKNVHWNKQRNKWTVMIRVDKKQKYIGLFEDLELAELVATEARDKYHKEFARHI